MLRDAMAAKRKYWSVITALPAPALAAQAKALEAAGLEGLFAPQVYGPPFVPLAAAAAVTGRIRLASGIAIAFTRSPVETALAAMDVDRISGGRFTLGLGTSVQPGLRASSARRMANRWSTCAKSWRSCGW
jgi:alkanesulfonate monooxygenase SsuD/methylene tetrahydromethanopterin reductase-like flavin-dependent oxidoreductase (luciferase family)